MVQLELGKFMTHQAVTQTKIDEILHNLNVQVSWMYNFYAKGKLFITLD